MSSTLTKASTRIVPWMNNVGRSTATAPIAATWPGEWSANRDVLGGDHDGQHEGHDQAAEGEHEMDAAPLRPGHERLDQHPGHGHAEDHQHRTELAVLDDRRVDGRRGR